MLQIVQFIHVLSAIVLLGLIIASFVYLSAGIKQRHVKVLQFALSASFVMDRFIAVILITLFLTGTWMVSLHHLSFQTPWIIVAYHVAALVSILWLILFLMKRKNYFFEHPKIFYVLNIVVIILLCLAIHDAVTQSTWFAPTHIARGQSDV